MNIFQSFRIEADKSLLTDFLDKIGLLKAWKSPNWHEKIKYNAHYANF